MTSDPPGGSEVGSGPAPNTDDGGSDPPVGSEVGSGHLEFFPPVHVEHSGLDLRGGAGLVEPLDFGPKRV